MASSLPPGSEVSPLPPLKPQQFELFRALILEQCGIRLGDTKTVLVQNRLGKRLRALGMKTFEEYYAYLKSATGQKLERVHLHSAITTNQTHFFREAHHFDIIRERLLPTLIKEAASPRKVRVWSAGCSTGQEVYSLAMMLDQELSQHPGWSFHVQGSDIDVNVLAVARGAVYPLEAKEQIPSRYAVKYVEVAAGQLRIKPSLTRHVRFVEQNLAEVKPSPTKFDLIICRNVIMYLDKAVRSRLAGVFHDSLSRGGHVILGSSETFQGIAHPFRLTRVDKTALYHRAAAPEQRRDAI